MSTKRNVAEEAVTKHMASPGDCSGLLRFLPLDFHSPDHME